MQVPALALYLTPLHLTPLRLTPLRLTPLHPYTLTPHTLAPHIRAPWSSCNRRGGFGRYPIESPREAEVGVTFQSSLVRRCASCHQNGLETFPMFAAAVIAAKVYKGKGTKVSVCRTRARTHTCVTHTCVCVCVCVWCVCVVCVCVCVCLYMCTCDWSQMKGGSKEVEGAYIFN